MRRRVALIFRLVIVLSLAVTLGSGCSAEDPEEPVTPPVVEEPAPPADDPAEDPVTEPEPTSDAITGTLGTPVTVGMWTVTVTEVEWNSGNDDVSVPSGMQRLEVEVDLANTSGDTLSVSSSDWSMVSGTTVYEVLQADRAQKQGERTVQAGRTEDVDMNFAVPDRNGSYVLRFAPEQGGPGILEVSIE